MSAPGMIDTDAASDAVNDPVNHPVKDDGPPLSDEEHMASTRSPKRRRWGLRLIAIIAVVCVVIVGGTVGVFYWRFRQITRRDAGCLDQGKNDCTPNANAAAAVSTIAIPTNGNQVITVTTKAPALGGNATPTADSSSASKNTTKPAKLTKSTKPVSTTTTIATGPLVDISGIARLGGKNTVNILMAGLDSRANIPADQEKSFGNVGGSRTDTIMVLRIDRDTHEAWVLSFPRDLWVRIAGTNTFNRLNAAYVKGLPTLVDTIRQNFGVPIWHVLTIDFVGFQKVVSTVGGVTICFPLPSRDILSGLNQPPGCNLLDPKQATAYVRSRHFQEGRKGKWVDDGKGDYGRIERQQKFIRAGLTRAIDKGSRNPITLNAMLANLKDAIQIDDTFNFSDVTSLANDFRQFDPEKLQSYKVPATNKRIDGKDVLIMNPAEAAKVVGQFGRPAP